jgi:molybdate transport system regulatory protein
MTGLRPNVISKFMDFDPLSAMPRPKHPLSPRLRIRLPLGELTAFGPGKADLLEALLKTGSLRGAARRMGLSYLRAWRLVDVMNASFRRPLVTTSRGGVHGGGAQVTVEGQKVLALYRAMEAAGTTAIRPAWRRLQARLRRTASAKK